MVIDIGTPFRTVLRRVYLENSRHFAAGTEPYVTRVLRPVIAATPATGVMDRLLAGPTPREYAAGLRLQRSRATGFANLSIRDQIARVRLTGSCGSGGSTFTIADEIFPTLKQFANVTHVKIHDPAGHTESPFGHRDSIPTCLEP
ncbi:MAG TPA: GerMN domain-containing protein [Solirubrobacteraceae bacterium]|nr:GerMN domain-containing protein [Solirubrobacteraceae bacterium]